MNFKHGTEKEPGILWGLLSQEIKSETQRWKTCLMATFIFGLVAHGYGFLNFTINHDSMAEFYLSEAAPMKISLGRFMEAFLRCVMGELMTLPWLTGLMGLLFVGLAVYLISKMFTLDTVWENTLLSGICVTNIVVTALIATYIHDFCGDMLSLLLSVCAAYAWHRMETGFSWKYTLLGALCLGASLAFYQSYLAVTITLICIDTILCLLRGNSVCFGIKRLLQAAPMGIIGVICYVACVYTTQQVFHVGPFNTGKDLLNFWTHPDEFISMVVVGYKTFMKDLFYPNRERSVQGVTTYAAAIVCLSNLILASGCGWIVLKAIYVNRIKKLEAALLLLLFALLPGCALCVGIFSTKNHNLTRYAVHLFFLLILLLMKYGREAGVVKHRKWQRPLAALLVMVSIISNIQISNMAYAKKELERQATTSTMTRLLFNLEQYEDYIYGKSKLAIIGYFDGDDVAVRSGELERIIGLGYRSQLTYREAIGVYFYAVLQYPVHMCSEDEIKEICATAEFQKMGIFPERDSIATINDIIVVRMSEKIPD